MVRLLFLMSLFFIGITHSHSQNFKIVSPKSVNISENSLKELIQAAKESKSDALVILKDGKLVAYEKFGTKETPIEAMSATKSVVSLAVGLLLDEKKIKSLDQPVSDFYPEWKEGQKAKVTLRYLLEHTSGIKTNPTTEEIYASSDFVKNALYSPISTEPGTRFFYNNKAVNLLAGIIGKAANKRMDLYLGEKLFKPLGIKDFSWTLDKSGNPHGMSGLQIKALDFAKIGQLILNGGVWNGRRIISKQWLENSIKQGEVTRKNDINCAMLWWLYYADQKISIDDSLLNQWKEKGIDEAIIEQLRPLAGKNFNDANTYHTAAIEKVGGLEKYRGLLQKLSDLSLPRLRYSHGAAKGFYADGYLGQYLFILPKEKIVAVRQRRYPSSQQEVNDPKLSFGEFFKKVDALDK